MNWTVNVHRTASKQLSKLPGKILDRAVKLMAEIELLGPKRGNWPNYSKLANNKHHCHLKKGNPTYVAVWEELDKNIKLVEVQYVGTHENAPY